MTEHTKIPLPGSGSIKEANMADTSLFERAGQSFGLEDLNAAPVPKKLPDAPIKRAKKVQRRSDPTVPAEKVEQQIETPQSIAQSAPVPVQTDAGHAVPQAYQPQPAPSSEASLPVPVSAGALVPTQAPPAIRLGGEPVKVDREHLRSGSFIVPEDPVTELLEEFRIIKRQIISAARAADNAASRRVLICSPHSGEGKTFCSANLAIALAAERGSEVLLVDADFAKPSLLSVFGLPPGPGMMDALADHSIDLESLPIRTDIPNLWVLPTGDQSLLDSEYLASKRTAEVLDRFTVGAPNRIMIFDTPPALAASPAAELAKHVGQAVLVARADFTGHSSLEDAYRLLSGCPDIKLLLNAAQFSPSGRRFGTYYGHEE